MDQELELILVGAEFGKSKMRNCDLDTPGAERARHATAFQLLNNGAWTSAVNPLETVW